MDVVLRRGNMFKQDLPRFGALITTLSKVHTKKFEPDVIEVYWNALKDFSIDDVERAVGYYTKGPRGMYIPKPADIIALIKCSPHNQALKAWDKALSAIHTHGQYSSVAFDDALIHIVIKDMGGWRKFCLTPDDRMLFTTSNFLERYRDYVTERPIYHPKYLAGSMSGRVEFIGDKEKVMQVIETGRNEPNLKQLSVDVNQIDTVKAVNE